MKAYISLWTVLLIASLGMIVMSAGFDNATQAKILNEGGWIETASWITYFTAAAFVLVQALRWPVRWSMVVGTMLLGMRELDFDKRFTTMGMFKSRFYFSDKVPGSEKLIALVVTALIVVALFFLVKKHFVPFLKNVKARKGAALSVLFAGGLLAFAKSIDGLSRKLEPFGIEPSDTVNKMAGNIEEIFELMGALLVLVGAAGAAFAIRQRSK